MSGLVPATSTICSHGENRIQHFEIKGKSWSIGAPSGDRPRAAAGQHKWVYAFGGGKAEGGSDMRNLLGGKGAGLAEMANLGLPVPPGFTITTEVCTHYYANGNTYPPELEQQVERGLAEVGRLTGRTFG